MRSRSIARGALLVALAGAASGQNFPFQLLLTQNGRSFPLSNGGPINFFANIGQSEIVQVTATYSGTGRAAVAEQPSLTGSPAFTATLTQTPPLTVGPGGNIGASIKFAPTAATQTNAQFRLNITETIPPAPDSFIPTVVLHSILLSLSGTAPSFIFSYALQTDGNSIPVDPNGTIAFPPSPVGAVAIATLAVTNRGSGSGLVTGISLVSGSAYRLSGLPLLPATIQPNQSVTAQIQYRPTAGASDAGQIRVTIDGESPVTLNLSGSGSSAALVYQSLQTSPPTAIAPGETLTVGGTNVGQNSSVVVRVVNNGNADGTVSAIAVSGAGYTLTNVPTFPKLLAPGTSFTFNVVFTPATPGTLTGTLTINTDTINLSGVGLGSQLTFSYVAAGTVVTLPATNPSVIFSPLQITQSADVSFTLKNTGTVGTTLSNIGVVQLPTPFTVLDLPGLPANLAPDASLTFRIRFTPFTLGFTNGTLQVDATTIALVGSGTRPPALPAYTINGPTGNVPAGSQQSIGLTLASPYPVTIAGSLTANIAGTLPIDPAVQFATGGRTIQFTIPANTTQALFVGQGSRIGLQTGTVASTLTLTPSFTTDQGGVTLNPDPLPVLQLTVAPAAPVISAVALSNPSATSLLIRVTGFSTTRTLTNFNIRFTPAQSVQMPNSQFTFDLGTVAAAWYRSTSSQTFGSQFSITVQFNFQGLPAAAPSLGASISSVAVTLANEQGTSSPIESKIP
jgi:hypothetical protein